LTNKSDPLRRQGTGQKSALELAIFLSLLRWQHTEADAGRGDKGDDEEMGAAAAGERVLV
jgi:hypothetical protein